MMLFFLSATVSERIIQSHKELAQLEKHPTDSSANASEIERLKSELALVKARTRVLESDLARSRKTVHVLLADDLQSSDENARLRETIWDAHQAVRAVCTCHVCQEVEQSRKELDGLSLNE